eukprot:2800716-Pleurochrysis_carterae.AAC.1
MHRAQAVGSQGVGHYIPMDGDESYLYIVERLVSRSRPVARRNLNTSLACVCQLEASFGVVRIGKAVR